MLLILLADVASYRTPVVIFTGDFRKAFAGASIRQPVPIFGTQKTARITQKSYGAHLVRTNNWARKQLNEAAH